MSEHSITEFFLFIPYKGKANAKTSLRLSIRFHCSMFETNVRSKTICLISYLHTVYNQLSCFKLFRPLFEQLILTVVHLSLYLKFFQGYIFVFVYPHFLVLLFLWIVCCTFFFVLVNSFNELFYRNVVFNKLCAYV